MAILEVYGMSNNVKDDLYGILHTLSLNNTYIQRECAINDMLAGDCWHGCEHCTFQKCDMFEDAMGSICEAYGDYNDGVM